MGGRHRGVKNLLERSWARLAGLGLDDVKDLAAPVEDPLGKATGDGGALSGRRSRQLLLSRAGPPNRCLDLTVRCLTDDAEGSVIERARHLELGARSGGEGGEAGGLPDGRLGR